MAISVEQTRSLLNAAQAAAENAYAPYSDFPVGAALLTTSGVLFTGVNVENASFGLTLCAERTAVVKAVSEGHRDFQAIAVWASRRPHGSVTPCGACRQVLAEFLSPHTPVILTDESNGQLRILSMAELLPEAFGPAFQR
ncbi:cytidine deaminase [Vampirovibrio chlorellavorus]|uniref:cytidine deaminase n=1 Tax=Vampirovibrio chlorellavorus TaxID=758823 RepID=UPI0026ED480C|nr:cytidine deaminase [Vampirovibrio chlorellavorus]